MKIRARSRLVNAAVAGVAILVSLGVLAAAELTLRWLEPVPSNPLHEDALRRSLGYLEPCSALGQIEAAPRGTQRIVILGESTGEFIGDELGRLASRASTFRVANCAQGGASFTTLVNRYQEALRHSPDAIVVIFGHNYDFDEPLTYWQIRLQQLRIHSRLMDTLAERMSPPSAPVRTRKDLAPLETFLRRAAEETRARGIRLVLNTLTSNYLYPAMPPRSGESLSPRIYEARFLRMKDPGLARSRLAAFVAGTDDPHAAFELGVWADVDADYALANAALERALDLDPTRFRATAQHNDTIRRVAREEGVLQRDAAKVYAAETADGLTAWETLSDNCHIHSDLFYREAVALLDLLDVPLSPAAHAEVEKRRAEANHLEMVLKHLGGWLDGGMCDESEWIFVGAFLRFAQMKEPQLDERVDAWLEERARRQPEKASSIRSRVLAASGQAHWLGGQKEAARALNERARAESEPAAIAWVWKGLYDVADDRTEEARASFSRALQIDPGRADARAYLQYLR